MDAATIRLHELNEELRNIDISEYHYIDGALVELKLVPQDVEILDPILYYLRHYTVEELWTKIKNGERIYEPPPPPSPPAEEEQEVKEGEEKVKEGEEKPNKEEAAAEPTPEQPKEVKVEAKKRPKKYVPEVKVLTVEEMEALKKKEKISSIVNLIQVAERGRQARLYFNEKYNENEHKKKLRLGLKPQEVDAENQEKSALQVQKLWRGHCARQLVKRKEKERRFLIGMYEPSWRSKEEFETLERNLHKRRDIRDQRIKEYIEANLNERARVFRVVGPGLMEDIGDEIREWFWQWYTQVKNFDNYPPEEKGGTVLVVRGETMTPKEWIDDVERKRKEKRKNKGRDKEKLKAEKEKQKKLKADQKKKEKEKKKKEMLRKKNKKLKPWDFELEYEPTIARDPFLKAFEEYHEFFDERKDADNPEEKTYMDIIHEEKCYEMQLELRKIVDDMMRLELEQLEEALLKDRAKVKGKKYKKKKKKKKKKPKSKKKKNKDMTANRTTEDLFQELVNNGIIHPYEKHYLTEFKGDFSYNNCEKRNQGFDPPATLGDVRQAVKLNCIAPLSTEAMKKPRSVLLAGPRQSGKHLLANAVFTESQSVLFDLSPEILAGKYPGKKGMKMLIHLINKMSRVLQPSVIFLDGAEKVFYKKVPKAEKQLDPKRIGKKLQKGIIKTIKPEDRVLVFGITGAPWLGKPGKMKKVFERIILMPRPDYGSVLLFWRDLLMPYHGVDRNIDLSCLTKLTVYYPLPVLQEVVKKVLCPARLIQLSYNPLKQSELYEALLKIDPITDKEYKKFLKFYKNTPLVKERARLNKYNEKIREQEAKAKEKQQAKKAR
ncbi:dynein regulatory complex protein 11-like isoform X2 [Zophobas morio]